MQPSTAHHQPASHTSPQHAAEIIPKLPVFWQIQCLALPNLPNFDLVHPVQTKHALRYNLRSRLWPMSSRHGDHWVKAKHFETAIGGYPFREQILEQPVVCSSPVEQTNFPVPILCWFLVYYSNSTDSHAQWGSRVGFVVYFRQPAAALAFTNPEGVGKHLICEQTMFHH